MSRSIVCLAILILLGASAWSSAESSSSEDHAKPPQFGTLCSVCHGGNAEGTDRAPGLVNNRRLRSQTEADIANIIGQGRNNMPPFATLPREQIQALARYVHSLNATAFDLKPDGDVAAGSEVFFGSGHCADCHMVYGRGSIAGPDLSSIARQLSLVELKEALEHPAGRRVSGYEKVRVTLRDGSNLVGFARNQGAHNVALQTADGRLHLLQDDEYKEISPVPRTGGPAFPGSPTEYRDVLSYLSTLGGAGVGPLQSPTTQPAEEAINAVLHPKEGDWPTYNGTLDGNRYSGLSDISTQNVAKLRPAWIHSLPYAPLETTPVVVDGLMYVTAPNQVVALDGRSGAQIWSYSRPRSAAEGISGDAAKGANRGVAVLGERVFFITDDAHLLCLHRITGALLWDVSMPGRAGKYGGTSAPLVVNNLVIAGVSGGDEAIRGFVAAFEASTGREVWRFWTVPAPGEPEMRTWKGSEPPMGGATWLSGSYDVTNKVLYWSTGNPYPDTDGDNRAGDNLYTNSVVALDPRTGKLLWHFQFTPHDLHDWDANQPLVLVDAPYKNESRKLLLHANRNGFFYVLDRIEGKFLSANAFVKKLTWASAIDASGRPVLTADNETTVGGVKACPAVRGATNWYSTAYSPATGLYYVMSVEDCTVYRKQRDGGYAPAPDAKNPAQKVLRAIELATGKIAWELPMKGSPEKNYSGVLATAGGVVFFGESSGGFAAADARTGRVLWSFETNQTLKASPMTYRAGGRQHVAIASGPNIISFALPKN